MIDMFLRRILLVLIVAVTVAAPADARRKKKKMTPPPPVPEAWPEEVPDYDVELPAEEVIKTEFTAVPLTDDQIIQSLVSQPIMGAAEIDADALSLFVARRNPDFDPAIARAYLAVGEKYGIRGDIALCQSILETGWFRFADGTAVTPDQHNYCGLGVTRRGMRGQSFDTIEQGVTAQIQHLYAYACADPIPGGEKLLDPRFKLVARGVAPTWADLAGRWAANDRYAHSIMRLYMELRRFSSSLNNRYEK